MALIIITCWYAIGLATAAVMARRGHDPMPWVFVGWLAGAWAPLLAVGYERHLRRKARAAASRSARLIDVRDPAPPPPPPLSRGPLEVNA